jgi:hypothetical protein
MARSRRIPGVLESTLRGEFKVGRAKERPWKIVTFVPSEELVRDFSDENDENEEDDEDDATGSSPLTGPHELLRANYETDTVTFTPRQLRSGEYIHRYRSITKIELNGFGLPEIQSPEDVSGLLESFPVGFTQSPDYGLGFLKDYRFLPLAFEALPTVDTLVFTRKQPVGLSGNRFVLKYSSFDELRRAIDTCHRHALALASEDKRNLAFNSFVHPIDPAKHPERSRLPNERTVYEVLQNGSLNRWSKKNQRAAIQAIEKNTPEILKKSRASLLHLRQYIELVNLDQLIERMRSLLDEQATESAWQRLFGQNPFILNLAFGYPAVLFQEQVAVGGTKFSLTGGKIADFILTNGLTHNLALVEIKTPKTPLFARSLRPGVFPPGHELSAAVTQVLDQRYQIEGQLTQLKENSDRHDIERFAIQCLVIAGSIPTDRDHKKSFELFRESLHGVSVITFDELLLKLTQLRDFLARAEGATKATLREDD